MVLYADTQYPTRIIFEIQIKIRQAVGRATELRRLQIKLGSFVQRVMGYHVQRIHLKIMCCGRHKESALPLHVSQTFLCILFYRFNIRFLWNLLLK